MPGMLEGIRVIEIGALGPAPFCGMLLADLGAEVTLVERRQPDPQFLDFGPTQINRGKQRVALDLKDPADRDRCLGLVGAADALIEGFRPGVMERLGLGPEQCRLRNPALVYGRITGWGQQGPWSHAAGHDQNYLALAGGLWYGGMPGTPPQTPATVNGDVGGALYLAIGVLSGVLRARSTGSGAVVDAAICDSAAHMNSLLLALREIGAMAPGRGDGQLDGSHWSRAYRCACGGYVSVQCVEPKFYRVFIERLGLGDEPLFTQQNDPAAWPRQAQRLEALFLERTRDEWTALFAGSDACFAPVLSPDEAREHPHMAARDAYRSPGGVLQAAPAPRFSDI